MKQFLPASWRLKLRVAQRGWQDRRSGLLGQLAAGHVAPADAASFQTQLRVLQPLGSATGLALENKKHNLRTAMRRLNESIVLPGQVFSFWRCVGEPNAEADYVHGRTITGGALATSIGGGLCQLSGMLYMLALQAGLKIVERHPHSKDIYTDATRFAPLGSDATVVYGYKDLRILNNSPAALCLRFDINEAGIEASLCSPQAFKPCHVEFKAQALEAATRVETLRQVDGQPQAERISCDVYPRLA